MSLETATVDLVSVSDEYERLRAWVGDEAGGHMPWPWLDRELSSAPVNDRCANNIQART